LSVDLPPPPLFIDELKQSIIPQVPLMQILGKFDGRTEKEYKTYKENFMKKYELLKLPKYLIVCYRVSVKPILFSSLKKTNLNFDFLIAIHKESILFGKKSDYSQLPNQVRTFVILNRGRY
jgi:hypothetical protein